MEFFEKLKNLINYNKFNLIGGVVLLGIVLFLNFGIYKICDEKITNMNAKNYMSTSLEKEEVEEEKEEYYKIDIKGAVNKPGVYKLVNGSRVIDQTCSIMIQRLRTIFQRNPLISMGI